MNDRAVIPQEISEDAADWFGRLETERPSDAIRAEFVRWLTTSPVHIEEFLRVAALHHALSRELKADPEWLAGVLADANGADDNVIWMRDRKKSGADEHRTSPRRIRRLWTAAALLLATAGVLALVRLSGPAGGADHFATAIGEQRQVVLADGSAVLLNTDTEIRVRMSRELRRVELLRGEAMFDVAKDPARPFRVVSDTASVQAIGTRFTVHRQERQTVVLVVEGRVSVSPVGPAPSAASVEPTTGVRDGETSATERTPMLDTAGAIELEAGQQVTIATGGVVAGRTVADVEVATSWTRGRMVFDSATLDTVVAEFNRYNVERLVIADEPLRDRRVTGVFKIDDPETFLVMLADLGDVRVDRTTDGRREIRLASSTNGSPRPLR